MHIYTDIPAPALLKQSKPPKDTETNTMSYHEQQHWITVQQKTFTKWVNTKLEVRGKEVKDLVRDLCDGVRGALHSCSLSSHPSLANALAPLPR